MRVAISAVEPEVNALVDSRFGRARHFMIYDTDARTWEPLENSTQMNAAQGAGIQTAETLTKHKVTAVITGHCGPKAYRTLSAAGVVVYIGAEGSVSDAFNALQEGKLSAASGPDVEDHW